MCRMVYLGASKPLRLVHWDAAKPGFHVEELLPQFRDSVGAHLEMLFLYYAGSHEGCGCGFPWGAVPEGLDDDSESARTRKALSEFRDYLRSQLLDVDEIQVFACWADDEGEEPTHRRSLTPDHLLKGDFCFLEGESLVFRVETW